MNYVIDCGPLCFIQEAESAREALMKAAFLSGFIKPGISDPNEWSFKDMGSDVCVGAYKDLEVRAYKLDRTFNVKAINYNLEELTRLHNIKYIY